jgi:KilA-N domain
MKTNQILVREDGFCQRTLDSYFNANLLVDYWNAKNIGKKKLLQNFKAIKETKEFIEQLKKEGIEKPYIAKGGKISDGITWMHPKLFIDFAMWISVEFKSKVIDMVLDGLIISRHDAGDFYNEMCVVIMEKYVEHFKTKPPSMIYIKEAKMINDILGIKNNRNELSEEQLRNITILQRVNAQLINDNVGKVSRIKQMQILNKSLNLQKRK